MKKTTLFALLIFSVLGSLAARPAEQADETKAVVPELSAFHDIMYPIWHTAYPEKDYAALRGFASEVGDKAGAVFAATLPGILRDKQEKWDQGVAEFKKAVEEYIALSASGADEAVWNAAEVLHDRYEKLVRIVRPPLKEVDAFHQELYVVYHRHLPAKDLAAIGAAAGVLRERAEVVTRATLPKRHEPRLEPFQKAAAELLQACRELETACAGGDPDSVASAVEGLHSKYQALEKVFE
ncbi:MAG: hypothetical protein FJY83_04900 [Candidatus Aminicenantes bacterium]|nr:hypothetical protein [Candidatus Aminicenantes bacterium]